MFIRKKIGFIALAVALGIAYLSTFAVAACYECAQAIDPKTGKLVIFCRPITGETAWYHCVIEDNTTCTVSGPGCYDPCFLPGTLVNTKGGLKPIEQLKVGDQVLSLEDGKKLQYNKVWFIYRAEHSSYYIINGTIKVTGSHPFFVNGKWTRVEDIKPGDKLLSKDLKPVVVKSIVRVDKPVRVYNFEVENAHNFFVQGILAHNHKHD